MHAPQCEQLPPQRTDARKVEPLRKSKLQTRLKRLSLRSLASSVDHTVADLGVTCSPTSGVFSDISVPMPHTRSASSLRAPHLVSKPWRGRSATTPISSRTPLLANPVVARSDSFEEPRPPTSNNLDSMQRAKLLKSARKLSRILGETTVLSDADDSAPESQPHPRVLNRHKSFEYEQLKSGSGMRPSTRPFIIPLSPMSRQAPPLPRSPPVLKIDCDVPVKRPPRTTSLMPLNSTLLYTIQSSDSSSSGTTPVTPDVPEFIGERKVARLARNLAQDENSRTDLIFPPHEPTSASSEKQSRPRSATLNLPNDSRPRRKSESSTAARKNTDVSLPSAKRSQTVRSSRSTRSSGNIARSRKSSVCEELSDTNKRQKAINVRRASKMVQVFGSPPPHALFQITKMRTRITDPEDDRGIPTTSDLWFDAPESPVDCSVPNGALHHQPTSSAASSLPISQLHCNPSADTDADIDTDTEASPTRSAGQLRVLYHRECTQTSAPSAPTSRARSARPLMFPCPPLAPPPFADYIQSHTGAGLSRASSPSLSADSHSVAPAVITSSTPAPTQLSPFTSKPPIPISVSIPPPVASPLPSHVTTDDGACNCSLSPIQAELQVPAAAPVECRSRVAKLSRFFGVRTHDLDVPLAPTPAPVPASVTAPLPAVCPTADLCESGDDHRVVHVRTDIRLDKNHKFWGRDEVPAQPSDIKDVLAKLREMRAV